MPTILHAVGDRSPSLTGTVTVDDGSDLTGMTGTFQMRREDSSTLKVNAAATTVSSGVGSATFRYDWVAGDVDTAGDYIGWFLGTLGGKTQRSPEFSIQIVDYVNVALSTRALVGLRETKDWLENLKIDTSNDLKITSLINAVSEEAHRFTRREFKVSGTNPQTRIIPVFQRGQTSPRYIDGQYVGDFSDYNRLIKLGDLASSPSQVQILGTDWSTVLETVSSTNMFFLRDELDPVSGPIRWLYLNTAAYPLSAGYQVKVTGNFGFPSVPEDVRHAVMDTVAYRMDRDVEHPRETLAAIPGTNDASALLVAQQPRLISFPPEAFATLNRYRDPVIG